MVMIFSNENLRLYCVVLNISIAFVFLIGIVSSIGGSGGHRLVGLVLLAIETLVWSWLSGKDWRRDVW